MAFERILMELRRSVTGSPIFARKTLPFMKESDALWLKNIMLMWHRIL